MTTKKRQPPKDPRSLAVKALDEIERRQAYADDYLDGLWKKVRGIDPRDRALATNLVYGVLRWRNRLDGAIVKGAGRKMKKIDRKLHNILRTGAYQIIFLDRIHEGAAVSETVETAKKLGHHRSKGFVNAVMRRIAETGGAFDDQGDRFESAGMEYGFPGWLISLWAEDEGMDNALSMASHFSRVPPTFLRMTTAGTSLQDSLETLSAAREKGVGRFSPEALWYTGGGDPREMDLISSGKAVIQGQASQLVANLLSPKEGSKILDACAAPGLKTTHLAAMMRDRGEITAVDLHAKRAAMVEKLAQRLGYSSIRTVRGDSTAFRGDTPFDGALVDAPCSGLGVLTHNPERKWRLKEEDLATFPPLQSAILINVAEQVNVGGTIVYATCTTSKAENEGVVENFLSSNPQWEIESPKGLVDDSLITGEGFFKTFPRDPADEPGEYLDGFFGARLRRRR